MATPTEIRQRAIALLEQLPGDSLVKAVELLEALSHETSLLQIIQHSLSPEEQNRLTYLRQQNETGEITDTEQQDAKRAEALIQLAQLRKVDLKMLIDEFLPTHSLSFVLPRTDPNGS